MSHTPKLPGPLQPPQGDTHYVCVPGSDLHGQRPPTEAQPIPQRKQLAMEGGSAETQGRSRTRARQFNQGARKSKGGY